jgi:hypothetical protein
MGHIRQLRGGYSLFGLGLRVSEGMAKRPAGCGSTVLRLRGCLIGAVSLAAMLAFGACNASAQPRGAPARSAPALPPSGHQNEPVDLNEGKSPAELFQAGCSVCHQSASGLAKGRRENELTTFLRQHYTSSVQHAGALAGFLTSGGRGGPAVAAPSRQQGPVERPPAPIGRRTPDDDRKAQEAVRAQEREPASKRKPPAVRPPPPAAQAAVPPPPQAPEAPAETGTAASAPPVEEKPAAPEIPL